jgi:hypothetical protein
VDGFAALVAERELPSPSCFSELVVRMVEFDVESMIERFKALGLLFSAVRFSDGSLRLFQWKEMSSHENREAIDALWASLPDSPETREKIAAFIESRTPQRVPSPSLVPGRLQGRVAAFGKLPP